MYEAVKCYAVLIVAATALLIQSTTTTATSSSTTSTTTTISINQNEWSKNQGWYTPLAFFVFCVLSPPTLLSLILFIIISILSTSLCQRLQNPSLTWAVCIVHDYSFTKEYKSTKVQKFKCKSYGPLPRPCSSATMNMGFFAVFQAVVIMLIFFFLNSPPTSNPTNFCLLLQLVLLESVSFLFFFLFLLFYHEAFSFQKSNL